MADTFSSFSSHEGVWQALVESGAFVRGNFTLASGIQASLKVDAERLYEHPRQFERVLGAFAAHPAIQQADTLLYVPNGMRRFMTELADRGDKPLVHAVRTPGATTKYDFSFASPENQELAYVARRPVIGEDVVTTLGSVAALRSLLPQSEVASLAILRRGDVRLQYRRGLTDHYLLERDIPTDYEQFRAMYGIDIPTDT